jgi:hypothetical protein
LKFVQINYESYQSIDLKKPYKNANKLCVFLGGGNNRNLLTALFKKRWWWRIDFVWTQLKVNEIFPRQSEGGNLLRQQLDIKQQKRRIE